MNLMLGLLVVIMIAMNGYALGLVGARVSVAGPFFLFCFELLLLKRCSLLYFLPHLGGVDFTIIGAGRI